MRKPTSWLAHTILVLMHGRVQRGDRGSRPPPPGKAQSYRVPYGLDPMENHRATKSSFEAGPPSANRNLNDGRFLVVFRSSLSLFN